MSLKAMIWVLHDAPTKNHTEFAILMALADRAGGHSDGDAAYPSQAWIADKAQCSVATVKRHLKELETRGLIKRGDQSIVSDFRVDRRPVVWDLCLDKTRTNSADNGSSNQAKSTVAQNEPPLNGDATVAQNEPNGSSNGDGTVAHSYELQTVLNHPKPPINQPPVVPQGGQPPKGKNSRGERLPENWMPDQRVIEVMARENPHVDLELEHAKFTDHFHASSQASARKRDWNAAWRNWIRRAAERAPRSRPQTNSLDAWGAPSTQQPAPGAMGELTW